MYQKALVFLAVSLTFISISPSLQATCKLCEDIRERNKQNPSSGYTYYEDYLKSQEGQKSKENQKKSEKKENKAEAK